MADAPRTWRRRWLIRLAVVALAAIAVFLFRQPILHGLANQLIVDDPPAENSPALLLEGGRCAEQAVLAFQERKTTEILVVDWRPDRTQRLGILPLSSARLREILARQGVPDGNVKDLPGQARDNDQVAQSIGVWLGQNPDRQLNVYCSRFRSRYLDVVFRRFLGEKRQRVHLQAVANPEYDEADWWRHKAGLKDFWQSAVRLAYVGTHAGPRLDPPEWDADAYERSLQ